jgi:hypothetical protein
MTRPIGSVIWAGPSGSQAIGRFDARGLRRIVRVYGVESADDIGCQIGVREIKSVVEDGDDYIRIALGQIPCSTGVDIADIAVGF